MGSSSHGGSSWEFKCLLAQRQRWAEGGLQRFFDYGDQLFTNKIDYLQKFDLTYFFILQYALPTISIFDLLFSISLLDSPIYWPISFTAFMLSGIAFWYGSSCKKWSTRIAKKQFLYGICIGFLFITLVFSNPLGNYKDVYFSQKDTLAKDSSYWNLIYSSRSIISPLKKIC